MHERPHELHARDFMQTDLLVVSPDMPLVDIRRLFVEQEIHGAPVVDEEGVVHGVVSTLDLLRARKDEAAEPAATAPAYFRDDLPQIASEWPADLEVGVDDVTAADVMTRELVTVTPDTSVGEVARRMRDQRIHRVLVLKGNELVGVITTFDLLRAFIHDN